MPDSALTEVVKAHRDNLTALFKLDPAENPDEWLSQITDGQHVAAQHPVYFVRREQVSRAAHQITAMVAAAHYDLFLHELANVVVAHVRKPPPGWKVTPYSCDDSNLGLAIGVKGQRVKSVNGSFNWDCNRPLSAMYNLYVPPSTSMSTVADVYKPPDD